MVHRYQYCKISKEHRYKNKHQRKLKCRLTSLIKLCIESKLIIIIIQPTLDHRDFCFPQIYSSIKTFDISS